MLLRISRGDVFVTRTDCRNDNDDPIQFRSNFSVAPRNRYSQTVRSFIDFSHDFPNIPLACPIWEKGYDVQGIRWNPAGRYIVCTHIHRIPSDSINNSGYG